EQNIKTAIISGGFELYVKKIAQELKADFFRANTTLIYDSAGNFKDFEYVIPDGRQAKVSSIKEICRTLKINEEQTIFVGDSLVDLEAFKFTQHGVLYQMTEFEAHIEELEKYAWKRISN